MSPADGDHSDPRRKASLEHPVAAALAAGALVTLLAGCSAPARYVVLPAGADGGTPHPEQRCIWLSPPDADAAHPVVGLWSWDARRYPREGLETASPLEQLLYLVVSGAYEDAERSLESLEGIPEYLRLLLAADLASERPRAEWPATAVVRLYQAAYDAQETAEGRSAIELRVRQLRYGR